MDPLFEDDCFKLKAKIRPHIADVLSKFKDRLNTHFMEYTVLSGGAIASLYHNDIPNDYDMYAECGAGLDYMLQEIATTDQWEIVLTDTGQHYSNAFDPTGKFESDNAITFKNKVQFIKLGDLESQRKQFDFIHCMPYYVLKTDTLYISESQWYSIKNKKLMLNPLCTREPRMGKYFERGWTCEDGHDNI